MDVLQRISNKIRFNSVRNEIHCHGKRVTEHILYKVQLDKFHHVSRMLYIKWPHKILQLISFHQKKMQKLILMQLTRRNGRTTYFKTLRLEGVKLLLAINKIKIYDKDA